MAYNEKATPGLELPAKKKRKNEYDQSSTNDYSIHLRK